MATRKVRVKKLNPKTGLGVHREDQIDHSEFEAISNENQIATGVEQAEENEYHLQTILKEAGTSNDQEIPVPPPEQSSVDFDRLYPTPFRGPQSFIRFSQTVEECVACQYDMLPEDDDFLRQYNSKKSAVEALSETNFERIMEVFEDTAAAQTPFASVDNTVVVYDVMVPSLNQLSSASILMPHAKAIYEYWKTRRLETGNKTLHPSLKFETHQESDDTDPYVCFRRREARQTRKTRARDMQSADKLKKLRRELEEGRQLIQLSHDREMHKRELMGMEKAIFDQRQRFKAMKIRLSIKGEDEDLIHQKPQKRKATDAPVLQRAPGNQLRLPTRPDGRSMDADLVTLESRRAEEENELRKDLETKVLYHRKWNHDFVDLTQGPLSPVDDQRTEVSFRPAKTQYLMTPPASSAESMDIDEEPMSPVPEKLPVFQFQTGCKEILYPPRQPAYRRRLGRGGRLWIDRRVTALQAPPSPDVDEGYSDRWKYDSDEDEAPPAYEVDPFSTEALRYRSTIPLPSFVWKRPKELTLDSGRELPQSGQALPAPPQSATSAHHQLAHAQIPTPKQAVAH